MSLRSNLFYLLYPPPQHLQKMLRTKNILNKIFQIHSCFFRFPPPQLQNLFSSCFCLWKEGGETHETSRVWNAWYQSQSGLSDVKLYTLYLLYTSHKCPCSFFFFTFSIIEIEDQSLIGSNWQQQDLLEVKIEQRVII